MTTKQLLGEILKSGALPGSYFPSRYYPKTLATEAPQQVIAFFRSMVEEWDFWYPQDISTPFRADLERIYLLTN